MAKKKTGRARGMISFLGSIFFLIAGWGCYFGDSSQNSTQHEQRIQSSEGMRQAKNIILVILENTSYSNAIHQPFLSQLASKGGLLTNFFAVTHPSQPNYIALVSGSTHDIRNDQNVTLDTRHLADLIEEAGKTWKVYAEGFPGNCFLGSRSGNYVRKHVPYLSFLNIQENPHRCQRIVDASQFDSDVNAMSLPDFAMYVPDMLNDGHDTDPAYADEWLSKTFGRYLADAKWAENTLLIVTFDEDDSKENNHIYTAFYGAGVQAGSESADRYDHYNLLRTLEEMMGLPDLAKNDKNKQVIQGIWK